MKVTHLYTGDDGQSHFREIELRMTRLEGTTLPLFAFDLPGVEGASLREFSSAMVDQDFHTAPRRQLVLQLTGSGEVDCGNGEVRRFVPGDLLLADDRTGRGHKSREVTGPRSQLFVYVSEEVDLFDR